MKEIPLTQGRVAIVDDEDFRFVSQWKWSFDGQYAVRGQFTEYLGRQNGHSWCRNQKIYLHREINRTPPGLETDHINRDKLDNRKGNLRSVTRGGNSRNHDAHRNNVTGVCGVNWYNAIKKFRASIVVNRTRVHLGYFADLTAATQARKEAEEQYCV